ncbi:hypothetical protein DF196_12430 [Bifidobacterium callitrichidarum]|uniref:CTP synthase n=2 Tax=Bifidobacterium callitrichidarum TaxID=2052941 RepID=A0A2U2MZ42_9BIFI|nr:hypothetical protein DF196_12430 [Bifidobacterium callitrichidarum]
MKTHKAVASLLQQARSEQRCAYSRVPAEQLAMQRRAKTGELIHVYRGVPSLYAPSGYWNDLTPPERTLHIAKALGLAHPQWVFGGLAAASAYGFEHQWCLHDDSVSIMTANHGSRQQHHQLKRVYMPDAQSTAFKDPSTGLLLASPAHTVIECARAYGFRFALPIFDSAFAKGLTVEQVTTACGRMRADVLPILKLLRHVNPKSENGGESFARGTMIEEGFTPPRIQVPVRDPQTGADYRVDFVWRLDGGRVVVAEYDGTRKYVDPAMTGNRGIQEMIAKERERDAGLQRAGAAEVVHFTYEDAMERTPLTMKLLRAGIPQTVNRKGRSDEGETSHPVS